jgi:hypothetical protein
MVTWYWVENSISQECNGIRSIALFASAIVLYVLFHCTLCVFDKSHPSKCFSYESISVFWYYIKQIMNVYSCNGKGKNSAVASLNGTFHLSPHENIITLTIARINIHYLYTLNWRWAHILHNDVFKTSALKTKISAILNRHCYHIATV